MSEPNPGMIEARLRFKRQIAAVLIMALADEGVTYAVVDARIGRKLGFTKRYINRLIEGTTKELDIVSDLCWGIGFVPMVTAQKINFARHEPPPDPVTEPSP